MLGWWTVIRREGSIRVPSGYFCAVWLCRCICGTERIVRGTYLRTGDSKSCGCQLGTHRHTAGPGNKPSREYVAWRNMHQRCSNPSYPSFEHYRAKGIKICERWTKFENFLADMGPHPGRGYSLDRWPNNDGNYEPDNCRWATRQEQANNRETNRLFIYHGRQFTLAELARYTRASKEMLRSRLCRSNRHWAVEAALSHPNHKGKSYKP